MCTQIQFTLKCALKYSAHWCVHLNTEHSEMCFRIQCTLRCALKYSAHWGLTVFIKRLARITSFHLLLTLFNFNFNVFTVCCFYHGTYCQVGNLLFTIDCFFNLKTFCSLFAVFIIWYTLSSWQSPVYYLLFSIWKISLFCQAGNLLFLSFGI